VSEQDVQALRALYEAFNDRDIEGMRAVFDPGVEIDETEDLAYAAALLRVLGPRFVILSAGYQGRDEVSRLFETVWEISEWFEVHPQRFEELGGGLVAVPLILRAKARDSEHQGEAETAHLWTVRDGMLTRLRVFASRTGALEAARREQQATGA
jgi:ketosteroid isomerase-like protein